MVIKLTDIQGLYIINPKTKEYLIRIGNSLFPFKNANEVFAYFLGLSKIKRVVNQRMNNEPQLNKQTKTMSLSPLSSLLSLSLSQRLRLVSLLSPNLSKKVEAFPSDFICIYMCGR